MVRVRKIHMTWCHFLWLTASVITVSWRHLENLDSTLCLLGLVLVETAPIIPLLPHFNHFGSPAYVSYISPILFLLYLRKSVLWPNKIGGYLCMILPRDTWVNKSWSEISPSSQQVGVGGTLTERELNQGSPEMAVKSHCVHNGQTRLWMTGLKLGIRF